MVGRSVSLDGSGGRWIRARVFQHCKNWTPSTSPPPPPAIPPRPLYISKLQTNYYFTSKKCPQIRLLGGGKKQSNSRRSWTEAICRVSSIISARAPFRPPSSGEMQRRKTRVSNSIDPISNGIASKPVCHYTKEVCQVRASPECGIRRLHGPNIFSRSEFWSLLYLILHFKILASP